MLTPKILQKIMPSCQHPEQWVRPLNDAMRKYGIKGANECASFLAQIAVESGELNHVQENLHYGPQRLTEVWPKHFPTTAAALPYARNPEKLGNKVYAHRLGNGAETSGDGFLYRGRGLIQITGRANYKRIGDELKLDFINMPDALLEPRYAALSAGAYWKLRGIDKLDDDANVVDETRVVNGGKHGLKERETYFAHAKKVLSDVGSNSNRGDSEANPASEGSASRQATRQSSTERQGNSWFE